jgi:hypothetical protein
VVKGCSTDRGERFLTFPPDVTKGARKMDARGSGLLSQATTPLFPVMPHAMGGCLSWKFNMYVPLSCLMRMPTANGSGN